MSKNSLLYDSVKHKQNNINSMTSTSTSTTLILRILWSKRKVIELLRMSLNLDYEQCKKFL